MSETTEQMTAPAWVGTVLESCIRDVALGRIASHSSVTAAMVADWRRLNAGRCQPPAPALTAEEARTLAAGERVDTVARAMWDITLQPIPWGEVNRPTQAVYRRLAAAAIAADPSPAEEAVRRVEALCAVKLASYPESVQHIAMVRVVDVRAALASPAPAPQGGDDEDDEDDGVDWAEVAWDDRELRGEAACCDPRDHSNGWDDDVQCPCPNHPRSYLHPRGEREWPAP